MVAGPVRSEAVARTADAGPVTTTWNDSCSLRAAEMEAEVSLWVEVPGRTFTSELAVQTWAAEAIAGAPAREKAAARSNQAGERWRYRRG